jgi:PAS domain S-box-containing protein
MTQIDPATTRGGPAPSSVCGLPPLEAFLAATRLSGDAIAIVRDHEVNGTEIAWNNPHFDHLLGQRTRQLIGHPLTALDARLLGAHDGHEDAIEALLQGDRGHVDMSVRRVDGSTAVVRATVAPVDSPSERHWALILREIGDEVRADEQLRASEERFRGLAGNAPIGIFFSEIGLRLGYVNERFAELFGRPSPALLGM